MRTPEEQLGRKLRNHFALIPSSHGYLVADLRTNLSAGEITSEQTDGYFRLVFIPELRRPLATDDLIELGMLLVRLRGEASAP